jgi:hypothetical protein
MVVKHQLETIINETINDVPSEILVETVVQYIIKTNSSYRPFITNEDVILEIKSQHHCLAVFLKFRMKDQYHHLYPEDERLFVYDILYIPTIKVFAELEKHGY